MDTASQTSPAVIDTALDAVISIDENHRIVSFNPAAERMFGYTAAEITGHNVIRLMPERFRAGHTERARGFASRGGAARRLAGIGSGVVGLRADGTEFPIDASVAIGRGPQGQVITAIIRDISEQVATLQALRDSEQRLRLAMESAGLGDAEADVVTGALRLNNLTAARLLGVGDDPARWVLPTFLEPVDPADRDLVRGKVEAIVREDRALDAEFRVNRPDGTQRWLYGRGRLRRGPQGQAEAVIAVLMDITERKENETRLRQLSAGVLAAHEDERRRIARELHDQIGQALTAALINLRMLPAGASQDIVHEVQSTLDDVLQQVRELSLNLRPSMLDSLGLEAALKWYLDRQRVLGRFAAHLSCQAARMPPATETLLFRLVQEAVTNVLRHAHARNLWVSVETRGDSVVLAVRDDGVGFDPKAVQQRAYQGGSFGVVGMAERAQLAGGTVTFESVPEQGTTVTAVLPLRG